MYHITAASWLRHSVTVHLMTFDKQSNARRIESNRIRTAQHRQLLVRNVIHSIYVCEQKVAETSGAQELEEEEEEEEEFIYATTTQIHTNDSSRQIKWIIQRLK